MSDPVLALDGVVKGAQGARVLDRACATFRRGALTAVVSHRGAGRSTLAALLDGRRLPDAGRVRRLGVVAPVVGTANGLGLAGRLDRDLGLRAAGWGLDARAYRAAVVEATLAATGLAPDLARPFERLDPLMRRTITHVAAWLVPADAYVVDAPLLPGEAALAAVLRPMIEAARREAAVVWLTAAPGALRAAAPDAILALEGGRLSPLADAEAAVARFGDASARRRSAGATTPVPMVEAEEPPLLLDDPLPPEPPPLPATPPRDLIALMRAGATREHAGA